MLSTADQIVWISVARGFGRLNQRGQVGTRLRALDRIAEQPVLALMPGFA